MFYLRYLELRDFVHIASFPGLGRLSRISLTLGWISSFGVSMVANFQEANQLQMHILGAFMVFGLGAVYMWIETFISYKIHLPELPKLHCHFRLALSATGFFAFVNMIVTIAIARHYYNPKDGRTPINWLPVKNNRQLASRKYFFSSCSFPEIIT